VGERFHACELFRQELPPLVLHFRQRKQLDNRSVVDSDWDMRMSRLFGVVSVSTLMTVPALAGTSSPPVSEPVVTAPEVRDPKGGYGDAAPLPPAPPEELAAGPGKITIGNETLDFRAQFGFSNDSATIERARVEYGERLISGKEVAFFPTTDAEHATFKRWLDLIDDRELNTFIMDNQSWFAEKENSFIVAKPSARFLVKKGAPAELLTTYRSLVPDGLDAPLVEVEWSGEDLESLRLPLAEEAAAIGARDVEMVPDMRKVTEESLQRSTLLQELGRRGVAVVWVKRADAQIVSLIVDVKKSALGDRAVAAPGQAALLDALKTSDIDSGLEVSNGLCKASVPQLIGEQ
jgi:hypothetical protein